MFSVKGTLKIRKRLILKIWNYGNEQIQNQLKTYLPIWTLLKTYSLLYPCMHLYNSKGLKNHQGTVNLISSDPPSKDTMPDTECPLNSLAMNKI